MISPTYIPWVIQMFTPMLILVLVCCFGDYVLEHTPAESHQYHMKKALVDSTTHGAIASLSWVIARGPPVSLRVIVESALCGVLASAIDADHFWAARSFSLEKALTLPRRPPLHNTFLILCVCMSLWLIVRLLGYYLESNALSFLPWLCFVAWFTHHTRDAHRRGYWMGPLGNTAPLSAKSTYVIVTLATALVTWCVLHVWGSSSSLRDVLWNKARSSHLSEKDQKLVDIA